jgi:hypothetical protein
MRNSETARHSDAYPLKSIPFKKCGLKISRIAKRRDKEESGANGVKAAPITDLILNIIYKKISF